MSLSSEYRRRFGWRSWPKIIEALPPVRGQVVLDLGCAVGDQAAEFVARGARVIGVDANATLLGEAALTRWVDRIPATGMAEHNADTARGAATTQAASSRLGSW